MDDFLNKKIVESELSEPFQKNLTRILSSELNPNQHYLSVGEFAEIIDKITALQSDLEFIDLSEQQINDFIYIALDRYVKKDTDKLVSLVNETILNDEFRRQIISINNPTSGIIAFFKALALLVEELFALINEKKDFLVLKKYREIMNVCDSLGIDESLLEKENEHLLRSLLKQRYYPHSLMYYPSSYKKFLREKKLNSEKEFRPDNFVYFLTYDAISYEFQKALHNKMKEYYRERRCFVRPYKENSYIYFLDNVIIIAYLYDDTPKMQLKKDHALSYSWHDREFWTKMFDPNIRYNPQLGKNYTIGSDESYQVIQTAFEEKGFNSLINRFVVAPESYIDEALYKALTDYSLPIDFFLLEKTKKMGLDVDSLTDKLLTNGNYFYYKDPSNVDELEPFNISEYKFLELIKSRETAEARKRSITALRVAALKNPKKPKYIPQPANVYPYPPKALRLKPEDYRRLPYSDD